MDARERARAARQGIAALPAALGAACFATALRAGFAYDDVWTIVHNRALDRPLSFLMATSLSGGRAAHGIRDVTRPVMVASTWIDHRLFGLKPAGYHAHSLLLYALVCSAAAIALYALSRRPAVAVAGGAFFAVAPVHAEVVAAVNYREDLISGLGVLLLVIWLFSARSRRETALHACVAGAVWLVALLAKESAVVLVVVAGGVLAVRRPGAWWYAARKKTLIALGVVLVAWAAWRLSMRVRGVDDVPLATRTAPLVTVLDTARYETQVLVSALAPVAWSPEYGPEPPASAVWLLPLGGAIAAAVALSRSRRTRPIAVGLAFALLAPLATSPIVGPANARADRYVFLAVLGGALVWGSMFDWLTARSRARRLSGTAGLAAMIVPLAVVAQPAAGAWQSELALWTAASERAPSSFRSWVGLSRARRVDGDLAGAETAVERARTLAPDSVSAHVTRAYVRLARGDVSGARADIARVRELGGAHQIGLRRAEQCAALEPRAASRCIIQAR